MSERDRHYCTGCGADSFLQCVECGEWRCVKHITSGPWCCIGFENGGRTATMRGAGCAKNRSPRTNCDYSGEHYGIVRRVEYLSRNSRLSMPELKISDHCQKHLEANAFWGWSWREVFDEAPGVVTHGSDPWLECAGCGVLRTRPRMTESDGKLYCRKCAAVEDKPECFGLSRPALLRLKVEAPLVKLTVKEITHYCYCENAPPRELVEGVIVRCGDGLIGGLPVMTPKLWTWSMRRELERHKAYRAVNILHRRLEREVKSPTTPDEYGASVWTIGDGNTANIPVRCILCGGWVRRRPVLL